MKRLFITLLSCCTLLMPAGADTTLPGRCSASLPQQLLKPTITEADANALASSQDWGQKHKANKYWTVYSDRSHNTTYSTPSTASKFGELDFNETVRIAKIENGFALVYAEKKEGTIYPEISNAAVSKGWVPMANLLLWNSCPTDQYGIYQKALIVLNIEGLDKMKDNESEINKRYTNPDTKDNPKEAISDMHFYFIMKKANGLVLLAKECKMEGLSDKVLYGWVGPYAFAPWSQRTCLEPNWKPEVAEALKGQWVNVNRKGMWGTKILMGRKNGIHEVEKTFPYRLEPQLLRYPLLENKSGNDSQYFITAFARPNGESSVPTIPMGGENDATELKEKMLEGQSIINLIVVIDGTKSMETFYDPTQKIIQKAYEYFGKSNKTVRVGVVIYRDYTDGQYVTECLTMRTPTDPSVAEFLKTGGKYGVKSSKEDHTYTEALYKGLETALDANKMGYLAENSNLMFVIGDCGNDLNDNKISQDEIIKKCKENHVQLMAFQVKNENEQSYLLFRKQMGAIIRGNCKNQYGNVGSNSRFKELVDGYDFESGLPANLNVYVGAMRYAKLGQSMDVSKLYTLMENSFMQFNTAISAGMDLTYGVEDVIRENEEAGASTKNTLNLEVLKTMPGGEKLIESVKKNNSLTALQGYTDKVDPNKNMAYWQPIIYISSNEFQQLLEKLGPVMSAAGTGDRKPYVDAIKELTRSMNPDITPEEMDKKDVKEIMAMVAGLNARTDAQGGRTLAEIQSEEKVSQAEFDGMVSNFQIKYNKLVKIHNNKYPFSVVRNRTTWYWIPVEDLP